MRRPAVHHGGSDAALLRRAGIRLGLHAAAIVSVIVVLLTATAVLVVLRGQRHAVDDQLTIVLLRADDLDDPPAGMWLAELGPDGAVRTTAGAPEQLRLADTLRRTATSRVPEAYQAYLGHREYRVQTAYRPDGRTYTAVLDLEGDHLARARLVTAMLGAGAVSLVLGGGFGAWLGRRATLPLSSALALQRRFVSDASHELRTPLTLLSTRAQLLRRNLRAERDPAEYATEVDRIVSDTRRLATILDDLLLAADPAAARIDEPVDLAVLAADVVAEVTADTAARIHLVGPDPVHPQRAARRSRVVRRRRCAVP
jgi:signal transduction histidine kinase